MTKEQIKEFVESHFHIEDEELHNEIFDNPDYLTNYRLFRMEISEEEKAKAQNDMLAHCIEEKNYSYVELEEYARVNRVDWYYIINHCRGVRLYIARQLRNYREIQKIKGEKPRTLAESLAIVKKSQEDNPSEV